MTDLSHKTPARVIALGYFDGVHRGHQALLSRACERAREKGVKSAALSFDEHPRGLIFGRDMQLLNTQDERADMLRRIGGVDEALFLHFDRELMQTAPDAFVTDVLVREFGAVHLVCGANYRFGAGGAGTPERLAALTARLGVGLDVIQDVTDAGAPVSSTRIRAALASGDIPLVNRLLGHPHEMSGHVCHGRRVGHKIGVPTVNILPGERLLPPFGVYVTRAFFTHGDYAAVTNIGLRPTFSDGGGVTIEPHLLGFDRDVYGEAVRLEFYAFLRAERVFASPEELGAQIRRDIAATEAYFAPRA